MRHTVDASAEISHEIAGESTQTSAAANELSRLSASLDTLVRSYKI
jgi:methyl-accepting chemotaxis protein